MRDKASLVRGWLRKAQSDRVAMEASFGAGALDVACFHAQQVVEKCLKGFLIHAGEDFPFTHNLSKLVAACAGLDASFQSLLELVEPLTPYAVELRYDAEFWPDSQAAEAARGAALQVQEFVFSKLPPALIPPAP
jgi:HEPN domain-containing protein